MGVLIHTKDERFFNCVSREVVRLAGMYCFYFVLDVVKSRKDPLYGEMEEEIFNPEKDSVNGIKLPCFTRATEHSTTASEEGRRTEWDAELWIAKKDWEQYIGVVGSNSSKPKIGDIILAWDKYYDVIDTHRDGFLDDERSVFTQWRLDLKKREKYDPERRTF